MHMYSLSKYALPGFPRPLPLMGNVLPHDKPPEPMGACGQPFAGPTVAVGQCLGPPEWMVSCGGSTAHSSTHSTSTSHQLTRAAMLGPPSRTGVAPRWMSETGMQQQQLCGLCSKAVRCCCDGKVIAPPGLRADALHSRHVGPDTVCSSPDVCRRGVNGSHHLAIVKWRPSSCGACCWLPGAQQLPTSRGHVLEIVNKVHGLS